MEKLHGVFTAIVTPFLNGQVDEGSLTKLLQDQLRRGVNGFVLCGTTGESPTLTETDRRVIFKTAKAVVGSKVPLIVGTGTNSTEKTVEESLRAQEMGADALLIVVPYYNKPPQRGLLQHFTAIADKVNIPILLYNVPGRTVAKLELKTIVELSRHPRIVGIKEASGDIKFAKQIRKATGKKFVLLSGDDATYVEFMKAGGNGVISVTSHIFPEAMLAQKIKPLAGLTDFLFIEANPIPVKMALYLQGLIKSPELRLPLVALDDAKTKKLKALLKKTSLL